MTHKTSILLVEDEKNICDFISTSLSAQDYKITETHSGKEALPIITSQCPDLILLDLGLPDMDGMEIIKQVRTWASIPIIVISARTQEQEKVKALDLGADDYLTDWDFRTAGQDPHRAPPQQPAEYGLAALQKTVSRQGFDH